MSHFARAFGGSVGANKGIGYEVARQLGQIHGMTVLLGARDAARGREAADGLTALGVDARAIQLDATAPHWLHCHRFEHPFGAADDRAGREGGGALGDFACRWTHWPVLR